jgi:para-nitrobenzyl esterase
VKEKRQWHWRPSDTRLAAQMSSYWTNFAKSGDPNGAGLTPWPAFNNTAHRVLYLVDPIAVGEVANIDSLAVLDTTYSTVRGKPFAAP